MTVEEVPDYVRQPAEVHLAKANQLTVLGPRKRKFVDYTLDRMSDREYLRRLSQQDNDTDVRKKKTKVGASPDAAETTTRSGRKRKLKGGAGTEQPKHKRESNHSRRKTGAKVSREGKANAGRTPKARRGAKGSKAGESNEEKDGKATKATRVLPLDFQSMMEVGD